MIASLVPIIVRLILAGLDHDQAREYIKTKFDGLKEKLLLAVFDAAWKLAEAAVGTKAGSLKFASEEAWLTSAKLGLKASPEWQQA